MPVAKRTLVKSGPELWAEVSDQEALGAHLDAFGSVRITRTADDSLVEWEGERASGRLELEPSGFGTRVSIQAAATAVEPEPAPPAQELEELEEKVGFFARLFKRKPQVIDVEPEPEIGIGPQGMSDEEVTAVLEALLDRLGSAHNRPFSRF